MFELHWVQKHSFVEIDHEILFTVNLSPPLIQDGQSSVSSGRMCTKYWAQLFKASLA